MSIRRPFTREQRTTVIYGMLCFILMLVILQLWLLTATMNAYLGGDVGFVTSVAATCVLGSQCLIVGGFWNAAVALWAIGIVLWVVLTHGIITLLTVKENKPNLAEGINGGWLLPVVAAQSVSVL